MQWATTFGVSRPEDCSRLGTSLISALGKKVSQEFHANSWDSANSEGDRDWEYVFSSFHPAEHPYPWYLRYSLRFHSGILGAEQGQFEKWFFSPASLFLPAFHSAGSWRRAGGSCCDTGDVVPCSGDAPSLSPLSLRHPALTNPTKQLCPQRQDRQRVPVRGSCSPRSHLWRGLAIKNDLCLRGRGRGPGAGSRARHEVSGPC